VTTRYEDAHGIVTGQQADVAVGMIRELYRDVPGPEVFGELNDLFIMAVTLSYDTEVLKLITRCFHTIYRERMAGDQTAETHAAAWTANESMVIEALREPEGRAALIILLRLSEGTPSPTGLRLYCALHPGYYDCVPDLEWAMTLIEAALEAGALDAAGAGDCAHDLHRALKEYGAETLGVADLAAAKERVQQRLGHLPRTPMPA
jgi:hypothetical protein